MSEPNDGLGAGRAAGVMVVCVATVLAACGGAADGEAGAGHADVERFVVGDTLVVRNHSELGVWGDTMTLEIDLEIGAVEGRPEQVFGDVTSIDVRPDGSLVVLDGQAPVVREYDAGGAYVRSLGRRGGGPGEFERPMVVRVDRRGRTLVLDWAGRMTVFGANGSPESTWNFTSFYPNYDFTVDTAGNSYVFARAPHPPGTPPARPGVFAGSRLAHVRYSPDGTPGDTLPEGGFYLDPPGSSRITVAVAPRIKDNFSPLGIALIHPFGWTITGTTDRYSLVMTPHSDDAASPQRSDVDQAEWRVLRFERVVDPAPINEDEWNEWQAYLDARVQRAKEALERLPVVAAIGRPPPQRAYFPQAPVKPYIHWPELGQDGRIWISRYAPSVKQPPSDEPPPAAPPGVPPLPPLSWTEPYHYDVFEVDGTFVGTVVVPDRYTMLRMGTDVVWGRYRDELDVPYVFRAKLVPFRR